MTGLLFFTQIGSLVRRIRNESTPPSYAHAHTLPTPRQWGGEEQRRGACANYLAARKKRKESLVSGNDLFVRVMKRVGGAFITRQLDGTQLDRSAAAGPPRRFKWAAGGNPLPLDPARSHRGQTN